MDWTAFSLSTKLAGLTALLLLPIGIVLARLLAFRKFTGHSLVQAAVAVPLLLPPTVLGFYLLTAFSGRSPLGKGFEWLVGNPLAFTFEGLLFASLIVNLPFAVQPMQRGFEAIPRDIREAAWCSGMSRWLTFWRIELPLAWPGVLTAMVLTFAHTMGEFGVVLMVGGNIPGETRTASIAIYDRVQAFDDAAAGTMSAVLLTFSFVAIAFIYLLDDRIRRRHA